MAFLVNKFYILKEINYSMRIIKQCFCKRIECRFNIVYWWKLLVWIRSLLDSYKIYAARQIGRRN